MNRIKELRKRKHLFQANLAEIVGVKQSTISGWEKGSFNPNEPQLLKLCEFFNCTPDYLMGYTDINLKEKNTDKNKLTLIGRNGNYSEYILTDEEMEAYEKIFQNRDKIRENNKGNF